MLMTNDNGVGDNCVNALGDPEIVLSTPYEQHAGGVGVDDIDGGIGDGGVNASGDPEIVLSTTYEQQGEHPAVQVRGRVAPMSNLCVSLHLEH